MPVKEIVLPARKNILVAGGAGFLGSHLCERLISEGHRVYCVDNLQTGLADNLCNLQRESRFDFVRHDIREPLPQVLKVDSIYNLACPASPLHYQADPVYTLMTCVAGTRNLLEYAVHAQATFVQASTSEVYGDPHQHPQTESYWGNVNPVGPRACYDEGKRAAEALCFDYLRLARVDVRVARIFNTYGPRMRADDGRIVSNFVTQALTGKPLTVYGTGRQTRSFCYVSDLIRGLVQLMDMKNNPAGPINLGNPREFTVLQLAKLVRTLTESRSAIAFEPLPTDDPQRRQPDIRRAKELLGWVPRVSLGQGLPPTVAWFSESLKTTTAVVRPAAAANVSQPVTI
jgi:UDP-glucuronate decarboxylase